MFTSDSRPRPRPSDITSDIPQEFQDNRWWPGAAVIALAALLLYALTRFGQFQGEDLTVLGQLNTNFRGLGDNLGFFSRDWGLEGRAYAPLSRLFFWTEFQVFKGQASGYHLVSALLHAGCAVLVWALAWQLTRRQGLAVCAGLFFAFQPAHVAVVAPLTGQANLLAAFFCLASATLLIANRRQQLANQDSGSRSYVLAIVFFGLALLFKQAAAALPLALLAYDFITAGLDRIRGYNLKTRRSGPHWLGYYAPFFALLALYLALNYAFVGGLTAFSAAANPAAPGGGIGEFLRGNLRFLAEPFSLGGTDGLILVAAGAAFLALTGVQEWEAWRLNYPQAAARTSQMVVTPLTEDDELDNPPPASQPAYTVRGIYDLPASVSESASFPAQTDEGVHSQARPSGPISSWIEEVPAKETTALPGQARPYYWSLRTAAYGFLWTAAFLLPFLSLAADQSTLYLASAGLAIGLGALLAPLGLGSVRLAVNQNVARALFGKFELSFWLRIVAIIAVLIMYFATSVARIDEWNRASKAYNVVISRLLDGL